MFKLKLPFEICMKQNIIVVVTLSKVKRKKIKKKTIRVCLQPDYSHVPLR